MGRRLETGDTVSGLQREGAQSLQTLLQQAEYSFRSLLSAVNSRSVPDPLSLHTWAFLLAPSSWRPLPRRRASSGRTGWGH